MGAAALLSLLSPIFSGIFKSAFPDPVAQAQAQAQLDQVMDALKEQESKDEAADRDSANKLIEAEVAQPGLLGKWHDICMWLCIALIFNNWFIVPVINTALHLFNIVYTIPLPPLPDEAWNFIYIALGGSSTLHSVNKVVDTHTKNKYQGSALQQDLSSLAKKATNSVEKGILNKVVSDAEQL